MHRYRWKIKPLCKYLIGFVFVLVQAQTIADDNKAVFTQISNESFTGRLWLPENIGSNPAILLIGGSGGGYENQDAKWLSSAGFVVLNVRYFGVKGLPDNLVNIPIEYFHNALHWLNKHEAVQQGAIGLFGHSKGTEAAILTAHNNELVKAVVLRAPSAIVWAGPGWAGFNESSWTVGQVPLNFHSVGLIDGAVWLSRILRNKKMITTREMFENALLEQSKAEQALLPVNEIKAHLLLLSGRDDKQWPSTVMANTLTSILTMSDFNYRYQHIAFENAGHRPGRQSKPDDTFANGGTVQGNSKAHEQTKIEVKAFFDTALRTFHK